MYILSHATCSQNIPECIKLYQWLHTKYYDKFNWLMWVVTFARKSPIAVFNTDRKSIVRQDEVKAMSESAAYWPSIWTKSQQSISAARNAMNGGRKQKMGTNLFGRTTATSLTSKWCWETTVFDEGWYSCYRLCSFTSYAKPIPPAHASFSTSNDPKPQATADEQQQHQELGEYQYEHCLNSLSCSMR